MQKENPTLIPMRLGGGAYFSTNYKSEDIGCSRALFITISRWIFYIHL